MHAFRRFVGVTSVETWCGVQADMVRDYASAEPNTGVKLTTDVITCLQCPQASLMDFFAPRGGTL